jgi:hypothetical protein
MVLAMPCELNVWMILFNARKIHGNVEMVEHIVAQIFEMELDNIIDYVLLLYIHVIVGNMHLHHGWQQ